MRLSCDSHMNFSFYQSFIVIFQPHQPLCFKMACGGLGEQKKADSEVQQICNQIKSQVEENTGKKFSEFHAIAYKTQVVAGTNYFIKVQVGDNLYVHLRVFRNLPPESKLELVAQKLGMTESDSIDYF